DDEIVFLHDRGDLSRGEEALGGVEDDLGGLFEGIVAAAFTLGLEERNVLVLDQLADAAALARVSQRLSLRRRRRLLRGGGARHIRRRRRQRQRQRQQWRWR